MDLKKIDFKGGKILYNDMCFIPSIPHQQQWLMIGEDLLQVEYPHGYLLDVGRRMGPNKNGDFVICIIKDDNWDNAIKAKTTRDIHRLEKYIQESIDCIVHLINAQPIKKETRPCNFDRKAFIEFFDEEYTMDEASGAYDYSIKLDKGFEFSIRILGIDKFVAIRLEQKKLKLSIFDIGFENIAYLKIDVDGATENWACLNLYKDTPSDHMPQGMEPYMKITIKPNVSFELTVP